MVRLRDSRLSLPPPPLVGARPLWQGAACYAGRHGESRAGAAEAGGRVPRRCGRKRGRGHGAAEQLNSHSTDGVRKNFGRFCVSDVFKFLTFFDRFFAENYSKEILRSHS